MRASSTSSTTRRLSRPLSALAGALLVLLTAQTALAVTWGSAVRLSQYENYRPELLRTGPSSAVAAWQRGTNVYLRRTADGGKTWATVQTVATGAMAWAASALGQQVDVAYIRRIVTDGSVAFRLYYRRSTNGGASWSTSVPLTSAASRIADVDVTRGSAGKVVVAWTGLTTGKLYTRRSTDGGTTFSAARYVTKTANWEPGAYVSYRSDPKVTLGTGVLYIAYTSKHDTVVIRRSTDGGVTWSATSLVTTANSGDYAILADGSRAIIAYTSTFTGPMKAVTRRTVDKGATWSTGKAVVTLATGEFSNNPQLAYREGVLAVTFKFGPPGASPVWHKQSTDFGATWSARTRVSLVHVEDSEPEPAGIAILDTGHIAGYNENRGPGSEGFWVRRTR